MARRLAALLIKDEPGIIWVSRRAVVYTGQHSSTSLVGGASHPIFYTFVALVMLALPALVGRCRWWW